MSANYTLGLLGSVFTLVLLYEMLRRRRLREKYAVFWATVAVFTIIVALFPATLSWAAQLVGVTVPANLLFFVASMLLLAVGIHHSYELGRLEERTRTLAEEVGLLRMDIESRSMTHVGPGRALPPDHAVAGSGLAAVPISPAGPARAGDRLLSPGASPKLQAHRGE